MYLFNFQVSVCLLVVFSSLGQAAPTGPAHATLDDTSEVRQAKEEFMQSFQRALDGLLSELAPLPVEDTEEVKQAKDEFFRIFNKAVDGVVETVFIGDTDDVKENKEAFFKTFNSAIDDLFVTVEGIYTPEQTEARKKFHLAYKDAKAGKVGAQYLEDTPEVKAAKERFFKYFNFVLDGMLYKLAPKPGQNVIPEEIADFYIKDEPDVAAEKEKFDELYRNALNGDTASAIAVVALEQALSNNEGDPEAAVKELDDTLEAIADAFEEEYTDLSESASSDIENEGNDGEDEIDGEEDEIYGEEDETDYEYPDDLALFDESEEDDFDYDADYSDI